MKRPQPRGCIGEKCGRYRFNGFSIVGDKHMREFGICGHTRRTVSVSRLFPCPLDDGQQLQMDLR